MSSIQVISKQLLDDVSSAAQAAPRQRKNFNFHQRGDDQCHRLLNALEPETYIPPHCHLDPAKGESVVILRGKVGVLFFSNTGIVTERLILSPNSDSLGVDIAPGKIHSLVALETNSVFFEAKAGPYVPLSANERVDWAPVENSDAAGNYLTWMKQKFS